MEIQEINILSKILASCSLLLLFAALTSCEKHKETQPYLHIHTSINSMGELWVTVNNAKPQLLQGEAEGYRAVISPDGKWMAVEIRVLSNLTVVRLYHREGSKFTTTSHKVTKMAWSQLASTKNINVTSLNNTRTSIAGWSADGQSLLLKLSARIPGKDTSLEEEVTIPLHSP